MNFNNYFLIFIFVLINSIFTSPSFLKSIYKTPVKLWQKLSYSTPLLDCQFEPSCSNYFLHAIDSTGIINGTIIGVDRIIRCNPGARHYHLQKDNPTFYNDGRIIDYVSFEKSTEIQSNYLYYSIIPGLGRAKNERQIDGLFSFLMVSSSLYKGYKFKNTHPNIAGFYFTLGSIFWISDFYGTWRTAKSATNRNK